MSPKPVFLNANAPPIGVAATWLQVAELVSERVGPIPVTDIPRHQSRDHAGFTSRFAGGFSAGSAVRRIPFAF